MPQSSAEDGSSRLGLGPRGRGVGLPPCAMVAVSDTARAPTMLGVPGRHARSRGRASLRAPGGPGDAHDGHRDPPPSRISGDGPAWRFPRCGTLSVRAAHDTGDMWPLRGAGGAGQVGRVNIDVAEGRSCGLKFRELYVDDSTMFKI